MLTGYKEVHIKVIRNLPGTDAADFEIKFVERSRPGCSLHQSAFLWNNAPAGAATGRKTGTRLCKPQHWSLSPATGNQAVPVLPKEEEGLMVIAPKDYFRTKAADSLTKLIPGGYSWKDGTTDFLKETTSTGLEFFFLKGARHFLQECMIASPHQ